MPSTLAATTLPYGLRDVKLVQYPTLAAVLFGTSLVDLPNAQTMEFNDTEDFDNLRGDDQIVTSHGQGSQVAWTLGSGGISYAAQAILAGGEITETGISPNQVRSLRKYTTDQRPFFTAMGQSISDNGGDMHTVLWLCRSTGDIEGKFEDGNFFIPGASGIGYPCRASGNVGGATITGAVYDFVQNESIVAIAAPVLDTPAVPNVYSLDHQAGLAAGGDLVKLYGSGFSTITSVHFGATIATDYTVETDTICWAIAPAHAAGLVNVNVTNPVGTSGSLTGNAYTYS